MMTKTRFFRAVSSDIKALSRFYPTGNASNLIETPPNLAHSRANPALARKGKAGFQGEAGFATAC
jgi:hypothetical protein